MPLSTATALLWQRRIALLRGDLTIGPDLRVLGVPMLETTVPEILIADANAT